MIYYVGLYEEIEKEPQRHIFLAAVNKMKYIAHALQSNNISGQIVSCAMSKNGAILEYNEHQISEKMSVIYFPSYGRKNLITKAVDRLLTLMRLCAFLHKNVKQDDVILVYHSMLYCDVLRWYLKLKKARFVLELEELYSDVTGKVDERRKELALAQKADAYIFPTQLLNDAVNTENKPFAIVHGTYQVEPDRMHKFDDGKIHVVYAGTLDPRKGGTAAAAAAQYLPENYHVHILGFGSEKEINDMKKLTQEISGKGMAAVTYDGLLSGEEYIRFIQACDIGLSTQNPDAAFNATSFPSKVLSYMANGLRVVSVRIEAIEVSAVGDLITYYEEQTPENIAKAIMSVDVSQPYDSRKRIAELDVQFQKDLKQLIEAK